MFKYILLFIFLISAPIYCGNWWSLRPSQPIQQKTEVNPTEVNPYEPLRKELSVYLEGLKLENITTTSNLQNYLQTAVNKDIWDKAKFPAFNALWEILKATEDNKKANEVRNAQMEVMQKFVEQKVATSSIIKADVEDENLED